MKWYNWTPHPISIYDEDKKTVLRTIPPSGHEARLLTKATERLPDVDGIRCIGARNHTCVAVVGLDENEIAAVRDETTKGEAAVIVSMLAAPMLHEMGFGFVFAPDTDKEGVVRNESGSVCGTIQLARYDNQ